MARLVTLDVTNTCIRVTHSVGYHYARVAQSHGQVLDHEVVNKQFSIHFKKTCSSFPCFGKIHNITSQQWWQKVVHGTLVNSGVKNEELISIIGQDLYHEFSGSQNWQVFDEVVPVLEQMKSAGLILGVVSNFDDRLHGILKSLDLQKYFKFVLAAFDVSCSKPDVQIFEMALSKAGVNPREAIHIGDDYTLDYLAARRAGMKSLLLKRSDDNHVAEEDRSEIHTTSSLSQAMRYILR